MRNRMAPNILLAVIPYSALAAVALRAAARRLQSRRVPGTESAPVKVTADGSRSRPASTAGPRDGTGHEMAGSPASSVEQVQDIFHELHADGRNALCAVCDGQYGSAGSVESVVQHGRVGDPDDRAFR